ncbi:MAG: hypothetical protein JO227_11530 [Acetobacteraceae bacterium]|nr:hypothetical protein [Acetobacteraceae bacterium]
MTIFAAWDNGSAAGPEESDENAARIAEGKKLFNEGAITVTGVARLNDGPGLGVVNGFCTTCHDTPNVGNHSVELPLNIGVGGAGGRWP